MPDFASFIPVLTALAAFLLVLSAVPQKNALARTIEAMEARAAAASPGSQSPASAGVWQRAVAVILTPERADKLSRRLIEAGWYTVAPAQIVLRVAGATIAGAIAALLIGHYVQVKQPNFLMILLQITIFVAVAYSPIFLLTRAVEARKEQVQKALPDFLDMVASTVGAGLSINAALAYAVDAAPGALGDEINEALAEIRLGRGRAEALKAAAERLNQEEFTTTVAAINQAEKVGANIGAILAEVADDTRTHHILIVEEHAAQLPIKMVFPMAFFLLPALFVIIFGSLVANYLAQQG